MDDDSNSENLLQKYIEVLPAIQELIHDDCMLAVTDCERFLSYLPGKTIDVKAKPGDIVSEKSSSMISIRTGDTVSVIVPKDVYGVSVKAGAVPIKNSSNEIIGSVMVGKSIDREESVRQIANHLKESINQLSSNTLDISKGSSQLNDMVNQLSSLVELSNQQINDTTKILHSINEMSDLTNVLGINAAIVAARAGNNGKGFQVIATEIRKMADLNHRSVVQAQVILDTIRDSIINITKVTENTSEISREQAGATEDNSDSIHSIGFMAESLMKIAQDL